MKIAIDISQIVYGTGVSNYVKNLIVNLLTIDQKNNYLFFGGSLRNQRQLKDFLNQINQGQFQAKINFISPHLANFIWNRLHILPIESILGPVDVYLSSDWAQGPTKQAKSLTIIYDLIPWLYPETLHPKIISTHKRRMRWVKKEAEEIIAISQSTKRDLVNIVGINEKKITIVYPGLDQARFCPQSQTKINQVKKKYQLKNYILALGTREPRKNFARVISAFEQLENNNQQLAIVGKYGWGKEVKTPNSKIKILGYVPDEDLPSLYSGAKVFVYPSLYEGFGMPVVEAQACGCPVITSNTSSLPEAAGEGAILVDPKNDQQIVQAIKKITTDQNLRKRLINRGIRNAKRFSWLETAKGVLAIIENL